MLSPRVLTMYYTTDHHFKPAKRRSVFLEHAFEEPHQWENIRKPSPLKFPNKISPAFGTYFPFLGKTKGAIFEAMQPMYVAMKLLGIFPITNSRLGVFETTSQWLSYSVVVFLVFGSIVAYVQWDSVQVSHTGSGGFEEQVIDYLFTVYLLPIVINPLVWFEAKKLAAVVTDLTSMEKNYVKITRKPLGLVLGSKPLIITAALFFAACAVMVITHITMTRFRFIQVVPYCYINAVLYLMGGFWYIQCDVLSQVALIFAEDFQHTLDHIGPSAQIAAYRALWVSLSKLIRDIANASGCAMIFLCVYLFLVVTLTIYGLLSRLLHGGFERKDFSLAITAVLAILFLFFLCDVQYYVTISITSSFQKKLLLIQHHWLSDDAHQEIFMFMRATEMSPSDMSLMGFFDVNRNLFKALMATMVTYLVVLLQFQITIRSDVKTGDNATVSVTEPNNL